MNANRYKHMVFEDHESVRRQRLASIVLHILLAKQAGKPLSEGEILDLARRSR